MPKGTTTPMPVNIKNTQPSVDAPKEWTDGTGPPRFMNMPYRASPKARLMRTMFHIRNMPRRFWTMMEWMKAVRPMKGMNPAFSTGSHAQ